mgnify:CR=1 FL=1
MFCYLVLTQSKTNFLFLGALKRPLKRDAVIHVSTDDGDVDENDGEGDDDEEDDGDLILFYLLSIDITYLFVNAKCLVYHHSMLCIKQYINAQ